MKETRKIECGLWVELSGDIYRLLLWRWCWAYWYSSGAWRLYGDNISEKRGKGRDWRGQVWKRPDFRRVCGGTAPVQGRDVAVILRKTASAAVGAFFAPRKAPGGPTNGAAGDDAQTYESPQKRRRQAIPGGLWYKIGRIASSRKSQQQTLEDEPPGP